MTSEQKIPHLQWVKGKPFVRIYIDGKRYSAPCTDQWLIQSGHKPARGLSNRVEKIRGMLQLNAGADSSKHSQRPVASSLGCAVASFIECRKEQPASIRPSQKQLERLVSTLQTGTSNRPSLAQVVGKRTRLQDVNSKDIESYERALEALHFGHNSIRSWMSDCRTFFSWCVNTGLIIGSPFRKGGYTVPPMKGAPGEDGQYSDSQLAQIENGLLKASTLSRYWTIARYTGARRIEILRIQFCDIDFDKKQIAIHGAAKNPSKEVKPRYVHLLPKFEAELRALQGVQDWYVCSLAPTPWTQNACRNACRRFNAKHGIHLGSQRMRRTFAQKMLSAGLALDQIAYALGNSPETLMSWYLVPRAQSWDARTQRILEGE